MLIEANLKNRLDKKGKILLHRLLAIDKEEYLVRKLGQVDAKFEIRLGMLRK